MSIAKTIEQSGSSKKGSDAAVAKIIKRANRSIDNIKSVWVKDVQAEVKNGKIVTWRVNCKVTFVLG